jgi:uncharacterized membrane protein YuzA (DUF378 family)
MTKKLPHWLVMIGALNWGLMGLGYFFDKDWNVVAWLFGSWPSVENIVYLLIGLSAVKVLWKMSK